MAFNRLHTTCPPCGLVFRQTGGQPALGRDGQDGYVGSHAGSLFQDGAQEFRGLAALVGAQVVHLVQDEEEARDFLAGLLQELHFDFGDGRVG